MSAPTLAGSPSHADQAHELRRPLLWGAVVGLLQVAAPLACWWLPAGAVDAVGMAVIAAIYVGFAVADGRTHVIVAETGVASAFVVLALAAVTGSPWLLVVGLLGHGAKDCWQHRTHFVSTTRWWPPFCAAVDLVAATAIAGEIAAGITFR